MVIRTLSRGCYAPSLHPHTTPLPLPLTLEAWTGPMPCSVLRLLRPLTTLTHLGGVDGPHALQRAEVGCVPARDEIEQLVVRADQVHVTHEETLLVRVNGGGGDKRVRCYGW